MLQLISNDFVNGLLAPLGVPPGWGLPLPEGQPLRSPEEALPYFGFLRASSQIS